MLNDDAAWDDDTEIDLELWLQALLAMTTDKKRKEKLVQGIEKKTGLPPEKIEMIISATLQFIIEKTRSN